MVYTRSTWLFNLFASGKTIFSLRLDKLDRRNEKWTRKGEICYWVDYLQSKSENKGNVPLSFSVSLWTDTTECFFFLLRNLAGILKRWAVCLWRQCVTTPKLQFSASFYVFQTPNVVRKSCPTGSSKLCVHHMSYSIKNQFSSVRDSWRYKSWLLFALSLSLFVAWRGH